MPEDTTEKKPLWKTILIALVTTVLPALAGYVVHAYSVHQENERLEKQIQLEQRQYDLRIRQAREANLKEYVPGLLSDRKDKRDLSVSMLTVLHPDEAPEILGKVAALSEEPVAEENSGDEEAAEEMASYAPAPSARVNRPRRPASVRSVKPPPTQQAYLEQKTEVLKALPSKQWFVVLQSADTKERLEKTRDQANIGNGDIIKDGKIWRLVLGPFPTKESADRTLISASRRVDTLSTPFVTSDPEWD